MIGEELYTRLSTWPALVALVGDASYPVAAPSAAAPPFVVFTHTTSDPRRAFDGTPVTECVFQIDSYANDYATAKSIAAAVKAALDEWSQPAPGLIFQSLFAGEHDDRDDAGNCFRIIQEFAVTHR